MAVRDIRINVRWMDRKEGVVIGILTEDTTVIQAFREAMKHWSTDKNGPQPERNKIAFRIDYAPVISETQTFPEGSKELQITGKL